MSCECYQIGGRFIAEDPDCVVHGRAADDRESTLRDAEAILHDPASTDDQLRSALGDVIDLLRNL